MRISLKVIIYLITASFRFLFVTGNKGGRIKINYGNNVTLVINKSPGETVQIACTYPASHDKNIKFLCKEESPSSCEKLIQTTEQEKDVVKGRFHIRDNKRTQYFYVDITNLRTDDSGSYWCGSSRTLHDGNVLLSVASHAAEGHITTKQSDSPALQPTKSSTTHKDHNSDMITIEVVLCLAFALLLTLMLVYVWVLWRCKLPRTQGESSEQRTNAEHNREGNHGEHHYDEIQMFNQQARSGDALPSVYATVNFPADQLHYASVNLQEDWVIGPTDANAFPDTCKSSSSACDYSSIRGSHPPAEEQTLFYP